MRCRHRGRYRFAADRTDCPRSSTIGRDSAGTPVLHPRTGYRVCVANAVTCFRYFARNSHGAQCYCFITQQNSSYVFVFFFWWKKKLKNWKINVVRSRENQFQRGFSAKEFHKSSVFRNFVVTIPASLVNNRFFIVIGFLSPIFFKSNTKKYPCFEFSEKQYNNTI